MDCAAIGRGISNESNTVFVTITDSIVTATNASGKGDSISSGGSRGVNRSNSIVSVSTGSNITENPTLSGSYTVLEGQTLNIPAGSALTLAEGAVLNNKGIIVNQGTITGNGSIQNDGTMYNIGPGAIHTQVGGNKIENLSEIEYLDEKESVNSVTDYTPLTSGATSWNNGYYVALGSVRIPARATVTGNVHFILTDGCSLTVNGGINVSGGNSLTIYGQAKGTGAVIAGEVGSGQAGIGSAQNQSGGIITINGGTVTATGGYNGAGIGGGYNSTGGAITINGGTVNATGGYDSAGIGGGDEGAGGDQIVINGGTVNA